MNAFEYAFWALAAWVLVRIVDRGEPRLWLVLGGVIGLGMLNKISMSWWALGLGVGLVLTPQRRWLATPWPWAAATIAFVLFLPHLLWQVEHGWPTIEFMRNATTAKMVAKSPVAFVADQFIVTHPLFAPLWLAGLASFFVTEWGRQHRVLAWIWITTFVLLLASGAVRATYLGPAYLPLFAAGGVAFARAAARPGWRCGSAGTRSSMPWSTPTCRSGPTSGRTRWCSARGSAIRAPSTCSAGHVACHPRSAATTATGSGGRVSRSQRSCWR